MSTLAHAPVGVEVLDSPDADGELVRRMLCDIARANRWLGGVSALGTGLHLLLGSTPPREPLTLLDVGTGAGDLPRAARVWGHRRGVEIRALGVERHRAAARLARDNGVPCLVACGSALPFRNSATGDAQRATATPAVGLRHPSPVASRSSGVDIILISQLLHHFDDDATIELIRAAATAARHGVILTDLRPMQGAALGFRLAGWALGFHPTTIDDGIVSMARGRSAAALAHLARCAGARHPQARTLAMARVVVAFRTGP